MVVRAGTLSRLASVYATRKVLMRYLRRRPACATSDRVFLQSNLKPITQVTIKQLFKKLKRKTEIPRLHPHLLRHPYVKPTTKKFLSFFKFEMAISLRAFLCFALLLGIKEGPQLVPFIR